MHDKNEARVRETLAWAEGRATALTNQQTAPVPSVPELTPAKGVQNQEPPPVAHSWYVVRVTASDAGSSTSDALVAAAKQKIEGLCAGDYAITDYRAYDGTGPDATVNGVHAAWLDATVACTAERPIAPETATAALTIDDLIKTPRSENAKPIPGADYVGVFSEELDRPYEAVYKAVTAVLKDRDDRVAWTDKEKGIVVTAYPPKWDVQRVEQFFIVLDPESGTQTRVTFKLIRRWRHAASSDKAEYHIDDHDTVNREAAAFVEAVRRSIRN
jgi:hypothetical protein